MAPVLVSLVAGLRKIGVSMAHCSPSYKAYSAPRVLTTSLSPSSTVATEKASCLMYASPLVLDQSSLNE